MFSRLFSRKRSIKSNSIPVRHRVADIEGLEGRLLLTAAPKVTSVIADNRGEVIIQLSRTVSGVSKSSVKLFTVGANGVIGDADDVRQPSQVVYSASTGRITIKGKLAANAGYRVRLDAKLITSLGDTRKLDGEFTGTFSSGNGTPGGNFAFQVKNDKTATPTARIYTTDGIITIKLRKDVAPNTVANFLSYANSGRFDNVFWTRTDDNGSSQPFVIQGGSLQVTGTGTTASDVVATTPDAAIADENPGGISNTSGTLAFAKGGANTATNQFFINLNDNSFLDPASNGGGFTVFAEITKGLDVALATQARVSTAADLTSQIGTVASGANTGVTNVPVTDKTLAEAALNPLRDLIVIRRIAVLDKIAPVV